MKYLFLVVLPIVCIASEPRFHFKDCVKVVKGFYRNCLGTVEDMNGNDHYYVNVQDCRGAGFTTVFNENELALSKGCQE